MTDTLRGDKGEDTEFEEMWKAVSAAAAAIITRDSAMWPHYVGMLLDLLAAQSEVEKEGLGEVFLKKVRHYITGRIKFGYWV